MMPEPATPPAAAPAPAHKRRHGVLPRLLDLLLSTNPRLRPRVALSLVVSVLYFIWSATELYCVHVGLLPAQPVYVICIINLIGASAFWPLIRSGWTLRFNDPGIVIAQMAWATFSIVLGYALLPLLRGPLPALLCLIQVYAMVNLRPRQSALMAAWTVAMLVLMVGIMGAWGPADFNLKSATTHVTIVIFVVVSLALNAMAFGKVQLSLQQQRIELKAAVDEVEKLVVRDPLTGLFNRQHMQGAIEHEANRFALAGQPFCVVLVDLDHFKRVNDTHGHNLGDEVLRVFSATVKSALRETDIISRWGGEEFLVMLAEADATKAKLTVERMRTAMNNVTIPTPQGPLKVTFSAGVARFCAGESMDHVIDRADRALYRAKSQGRDCTVLDQVEIQPPGSRLAATAP